MANPEHVEIVRKGTVAISEWRKAHPGKVLDLTASLNLQLPHSLPADSVIGGDQVTVDLDFRGVNLTDANLADALLHGVNFSGACLARADLTNAHLCEANLAGANLADAALIHASFLNTILTETNLEGAQLGFTAFAHVDLSRVHLRGVRHFLPCEIGIDTLHLSCVQGLASELETFFRGCGVPDDLIEYARSIAGAIQFFSSFISYSSQNEDFAKRLHSAMQAEHLRVWFAPEDMKGGRKTLDQLKDAIRFHDKLLLVLSPASMNSSWVQREVRVARQRKKKEGKQVLFPVRLCSIEELREWKLDDGETGEDLAAEIRSYHIPDFSNWKDHDAFEAAFQRLLRDLRAGE